MGKRTIVRGGDEPEAQEVDVRRLPAGRLKTAIERGIAGGKYKRGTEGNTDVYTPKKGGESKE